MKTKLSLSVDDALLSEMKVYACKQNKSISELVSDYFTTIIKSTNHKNIIELVNALDAPLIEVNINLKETYYNKFL